MGARGRACAKEARRRNTQNRRSRERVLGKGRARDTERHSLRSPFSVAFGQTFAIARTFSLDDGSGNLCKTQRACPVQSAVLPAVLGAGYFISDEYVPRG